MPRPVLHAFIDEAGDRSRRPTASDHFVMSAVVLRQPRLVEATQFLAGLRTEIGRQPTDVLHWRNFKHQERVHVAKRLGEQPWLLISSVVVCKKHLTGSLLSEDQAYLYTFRFLLERLSWLARDNNHDLHYTLAHIVRFKLANLRQYEAALRATPGNQVAWQVIPKGGAIDQPSRVEHLQLADAAASAVFAGFEPDKYGNTETRYLELLKARFYRRLNAPLTSYGLKIHPYNGSTKAAYPWVAAL